jgi:hypothetical protein
VAASGVGGEDRSDKPAIDGDGIGAGEAEWYAPGDEPSGWVSRGGPDNRPESSNADQMDTDADEIADACEAPVVSDPVLTDPALTGASV